MDGSVHDPDLLRDMDQVQRLVLAAIGKAGMQLINLTVSNIKLDLAKLNKPVFDDEGGISIGALISTSHCYLHVWPERGRFMFDLVSCRPFDIGGLGAWLYDTLKVDEITHLHEVDPDVLSNTSVFVAEYSTGTG
jgi:S-adenosylmethionine/arginine decarboxylase-like enzyme